MHFFFKKRRRVYGRDLQVAGGQNNVGAARRALGALDSTWIMIRPRVVGAGGTGAAKRFDFALHRALSGVRRETWAPRPLPFWTKWTR